MIFCVQNVALEIVEYPEIGPTHKQCRIFQKGCKIVPGIRIGLPASNAPPQVAASVNEHKEYGVFEKSHPVWDKVAEV